MKQSFLLTFFLVLLQTTYSQVSITNITTGYNQDFNTLASTDTSSVLPMGWVFAETGMNANNTYAADHGTTNSGNTYSYGATGAAERAFGTLLSGSVTSTIGVAFTNNSTATITEFTITYTGEQWRIGTLGRVDRIDFQYSLNATSLNSGTWIDVDNLDFVAPVTTGTIGPLNGNDAANQTLKTATITNVSIAPGTTFYLRWLDFNATNADDGLAVDNFSITFNGATLPECIAPTAQPTSLTFSNITNTNITGNFTAASPAADQYLTIISTSSTLSALPQNRSSYEEGDIVGNGTVVAVGSTNTFSATSLSPGTNYYFYLFALNSNCTGGPVYNTTSPLTGSATTTTPPACTAPTSAPGTLSFNTAGASISGSFTAATGADSYFIIRSTNSIIDFTPANGTSYTVGQSVGSTSTGIVVKSGEGTTFLTTGLTPNTNYYFFVYAVSNTQCTGGPLYNTTATFGSATTTSGGSGAPAGYYVTAIDKTCADLKTTLKTITTTNHTPKSYGDLWVQYLVSDIKPREVGPGTSPTVIWDVYSDNPAGTDPYNFTPGPVTTGGQQDNGTSTSTEGQFYNREHSVPLSWFNGSTSIAGPATDYHHIFPTDKVVNAVRSNYIYGEVADATYTSLNGSKLGTSAIAGFTGPVFEPINEYKGDLARAFLYFVTRYQDNMSGWPEGSNGAQAFDPTTYPSVDIPYLQLMVKWHEQDPVSQKEIDRNNAGFSFQGNRNPYIDSPQYVMRVWNSGCPGLSLLPVDIIFFTGKLVGSQIKLEWTSENEINFEKYEVERSFNGSTYTKIGDVTAKNLRTYSYFDNADPIRGKRVFYRLKKIDKDGKYKYSEVFTLHVPYNTKFSVYPNPANTYIQLQFNKNVNGRINVELTDVSGKVLQKHNLVVTGNTLKLNTTNVSSGTYFVRVNFGGEQYMQKVIVSK